MDLQNTFYFLAIVFMGLSITILIGIVVLLVYIMKVIKDIHKNISEKIDMLGKRATESSSLAVDIGTAVAGTVITKAKQAFRKD